jgi:hypothetical protein
MAAAQMKQPMNMVTTTTNPTPQIPCPQVVVESSRDISGGGEVAIHRKKYMRSTVNA